MENTFEINTYPDGTHYVELETHDTPQVFRLNSYKDLWKLKQFVEVYNHKYANKPTIIIPNLLDAQADRRFSDNQSYGLKLVLQELINLDAYIQIYHPHNPEVVEMAFEVSNKKVTLQDNSMFITKVLYDIGNSYSIGIQQEYFKTKQGIFMDRRVVDNTVLLSADAGGFKPLINLCDKIGWEGEVTSASKSRSYENGETVLNQIIGKKDFEGKDVLIVDDICVYGGTFKGLATKLKECNVGRLFLAVSHMTVQHLGTDPVTNYFNEVYTTNSKYNSYFTPTKNGGKVPSNLIIKKYF